MAALVTLEDVNLALKLDLVQSGSPLEFTDYRVPDIQQKMTEATDIVLDYIGQPRGWTVDNVPGRVSAAIKLVIGSLLDDSAEADILTGLSGGDLNNPVVALLYRLRDPAIA